ncbi:MAG: GNAT family N-acetyltransferase [Chloroflexi bacterium]|nr:GNAT family N-acetyltransferase [Chloroflexota bacterium]MCC6896837.1 GNAT family N-acetyltransferase [Anaerolineae bacterium]
MVGLQASHNPAFVQEGPRPVNLRTDLGQLADLIEIAFASSMDSSGRAAVREMRTMSSLPGIGLLGGLNTLMQGMGMGQVWIADGRLVGNVSIYPADGIGYDGRDWVIVNVAVHPDYQRRGIAQHLMQASMEMIAQRGGRKAMLQVDADNPVARRLYARLGFVDERGWTSWRRGGAYNIPQPFAAEERIHIVRRQSSEWQAEYRLASLVRPAELGGLGWLRPLHERQFRRGLRQTLSDWFSFRQRERLAIRSDDERDLLASMWIETSLSHTTQMTLMVHPDFEGLYDEALINTAVRRFGTAALGIEHPTDRVVTSSILKRYQFAMRREVVHMTWTPAG